MKILHNTDRIEAFSDAVFAFAATLLMVSLNDETQLSVLDIKWVDFIGFFCSFFALLLIWKAHYNFFRRTSYIDNWLITFNSVLLFAVLYFVFPLKSLISSMFRQQKLTYDSLASLFELYGIGILVIFLCLSLMYCRVYRQDSKAENRHELFFYTKHFFIYVLVSGLSILMAFGKVGIEYGIPGFAYFLLGPLCYLNSYFHYRKAKVEPKNEIEA